MLRYEAACDKLEYLASLVSMDDIAFGRQPWAGEFLLEATEEGVLRRLQGDLVVGIPLVGPRARPLIISRRQRIPSAKN